MIIAVDAIVIVAVASCGGREDAEDSLCESIMYGDSRHRQSVLQNTFNEKDVFGIMLLALRVLWQAGHRRYIAHFRS